MILSTTGFIHLNRWAFNGPIATENTTITIYGLQYCLTVFAGIKILAGIGGHSFFFAMPTGRTGNI
jgi:hypothetical protein